MAVVYIHGRRVFLGPWPEHPKPPSSEVQAKYKAALVVANLSDRPQPIAQSTMAILVDKVTDWAADYYQTAPKDLWAIAQAAQLLLAVTGKVMRVEELGPSHIVACRDALVASGRTRQGINKSLGLIRRILRRGCELGLLPPAVLTGCLVVPGLRPGRTAAPEALRREGVPEQCGARRQPPESSALEVAPDVASCRSSLGGLRARADPAFAPEDQIGRRQVSVDTDHLCGDPEVVPA
jgi:hypothetical protein